MTDECVVACMHCIRIVWLSFNRTRTLYCITSKNIAYIYNLVICWLPWTTEKILSCLVGQWVFPWPLVGVYTRFTTTCTSYILIMFYTHYTTMFTKYSNNIHEEVITNMLEKVVSTLYSNKILPYNLYLGMWVTWHQRAILRLCIWSFIISRCGSVVHSGSV